MKTIHYRHAHFVIKSWYTPPLFVTTQSHYIHDQVSGLLVGLSNFGFLVLGKPFQNSQRKPVNYTLNLTKRLPHFLKRSVDRITAGGSHTPL
jgi:hypothetical protein